MSASAKDVIRKYLKKVKCLYEKLSQKQQQQQKTATIVTVASLAMRTEKSGKNKEISASSTRKENNSVFSGNLKYPRRKYCVSSEIRTKR
uniref:Uncharacterized protein n=1 Tax=Nelumbo nucifera TaxID=4432 RepID=A0A822Y5J5_NELNU|nr:TPA_asm: hypothetical protein HUJ06_028970 [Nelumbo nucifera]